MELTSIAFIPDGNRRYAFRSGIELAKSYQLGTEKAWDVLNWLVDYPKIRAGAFYTLSLENLARSKAELSVLFKLFEKELDKAMDRRIIETEKISLKFIGRTAAFPKRIQQKMREVEEFTEDNNKKTIYLALGYNGQAEIVDAAKKFAESYKNNSVSLSELNESSFNKFLYAEMPNPDLIIRTSGTQRLSGFLTYQSAYSELFFCPKFWPEFSKQDLDSAITDFNERNRKFGK